MLLSRPGQLKPGLALRLPLHVMPWHSRIYKHGFSDAVHSEKYIQPCERKEACSSQLTCSWPLKLCLYLHIGLKTPAVPPNEKSPVNRLSSNLPPTKSAWTGNPAIAMHDCRHPPQTKEVRRYHAEYITTRHQIRQQSSARPSCKHS